MCTSLDKYQHNILNKPAEAACLSEMLATIYEIMSMSHIHKKMLLSYKDILIESKVIFTLLIMLVYFILQQYASSLTWPICIASMAKAPISGKHRERNNKNENITHKC
jgi:hypothetical protein